MGTTLTGTTPANTYDSLIKVTDNGPLSGTAKYLSDGLGNDSVLALSTAQVGIGVIPAANVGNLQVGGAVNASIFSQQGTDTVRAGVRASGRVGIVFDSSNATYTNRMWYLDSFGANGTLTIGRQGLDVMTFANAGYVGIGTSSPNAPLEILSNASANALRLRARTNDDYSFIQFANNASNAILGEIFSQQTGTGIGRLGFSTANGAGSIERMTISPAGNVGIGTSNPADKLEIAGNIRANVSNGSGFMLTGASASGLVRNGGTGLSLRTNTTDRLTIDNNGNVGIGIDSPNVKLDVLNTMRVQASGQGIFYLSNGVVQHQIVVEANPNNKLAFKWNGTERMALTDNGLTFNGDTAAANALDDYEEGTFTPTVVGVTTAGTTTYTGQNGYYTKIGRQVTVSLYVGYSSLTGTGDMRIGGLPFVIGNFTQNYPVGSCISSSVNWTGGTYLQAIGYQNESNLYIAYMADDASSNVQQCVDEVGTFRITMTYFTA